MTMRKSHLSDDQSRESIGAYHACGNGSTQTRYQAVRLCGPEYPVAEIHTNSGCSISSLIEWRRAYSKYSKKALHDRRLGCNAANLADEQRAEVETRLHDYAQHHLLGPADQTAEGQFWAVQGLEKALGQWFAVRCARHISHVRLFHAYAFSYHRPEKVFKLQRPLQMAEFEEQVEKPDGCGLDGSGDRNSGGR